MRLQFGADAAMPRQAWQHRERRSRRGTASARLGIAVCTFFFAARTFVTPSYKACLRPAAAQRWRTQRQQSVGKAAEPSDVDLLTPEGLCEDYTTAKLKKELRENGESDEGLKEELCERLAAAYTRQGQVTAAQENYDPGLTQLQAGKHKGETYKFISETDKEYCKYITNQVAAGKLGTSYQDFANYLQNVNSETAAAADSPKQEAAAAANSPKQEAAAAADSPKQEAAAAADSPTQDGGMDGTRTVGFGKHSGETFEQVLKEDPTYCEWVMRTAAEDDAGPGMQDFGAYLQSVNFVAAAAAAPSTQDGEVDGTMTVSFGKHSGKTFEQVWKDDADYCDWVMRQAAGDDAGFGIKAFARYLQSVNFAIAADVAPDATMMVTFGKHSGKTFEQVLQEDGDYCDWVVRKAADDDAGYKLKMFAEYLQSAAAAQQQPSSFSAAAASSEQDGR